MDFIVSATAFLVAIGVLVAVHEYGHYFAARRLGVKVLRYSIGFGRPVWLRRAGPDRTEYCLSAIPFGGYVKLLDERDCPVTLAEQHRAFNRQSVTARIAILAAGPILNLLFAIVAYWAMFVIGVPGTRPLVGDIAADSIADRAGLRSGDEIIRVGGTATTTLEGAVIAILDQLLGGASIPLAVRDEAGRERELALDIGDQAAALTEPGALFTGLGFEPWAPILPPVIGELVPAGSAARSGLQRGDLLLEADGTVIDTWPQWVEYVRERPGRSIDLLIERGATRQSLVLVVERAVAEDGKPIGRIGAGPDVPPDIAAPLRALERYPIGAAFSKAVARTWEMSSLTLRMIGRMITGDVSVKNISGPINIAQYAGYSAGIGPSAFLSFLAVVSISLGLLNLLPIPMLDGGQIVFQLAEGLRGAPLSEKSQLVGQQIGIALLLMLMSLAFYNDIARLLG